MKKVLSLLVIFVFLNVNSWAFAPNFTSASGIIPSGTYAGVLIPTATAVASTSSASIGVFAIGIPTTAADFVQGAGVLFSQGAAYNSTVTGTFDPATSTVTAIIEGNANVATTTFTNGQQTISTNTEIFAQGGFQATLSAPKQSKTSGTGPGTANAERLKGTASVDLFGKTNASGSPIITGTVAFTIDGFQQSSNFRVPTVAVSIGGGTTTGG